MAEVHDQDLVVDVGRAWLLAGHHVAVGTLADSTSAIVNLVAELVHALECRLAVNNLCCLTCSR